MTIRERILVIRLTEKLTKYPAYAEALGVEIFTTANNQKALPDCQAKHRSK